MKNLIFVLAIALCLPISCTKESSLRQASDIASVSQTPAFKPGKSAAK